MTLTGYNNDRDSCCSGNITENFPVVMRTAPNRGGSRDAKSFPVMMPTALDNSRGSGGSDSFQITTLTGRNNDRNGGNGGMESSPVIMRTAPNNDHIGSGDEVRFPSLMGTTLDNSREAGRSDSFPITTLTGRNNDHNGGNDGMESSPGIMRTAANNDRVGSGDQASFPSLMGSTLDNGRGGGGSDSFSTDTPRSEERGGWEAASPRPMERTANGGGSRPCDDGSERGTRRGARNVLGGFRTVLRRPLAVATAAWMRQDAETAPEGTMVTLDDLRQRSLHADPHLHGIISRLISRCVNGEREEYYIPVSKL